MCNHDIGPERTKNAFLEGGSRKLILGCSENSRKGVIYHFQIKINMYAVISHSIHHLTVRTKIEETLTMMWCGHDCKHTILIVSYTSSI
jgi:hypothetical protein